ncbi:MAG TPA: hypothetical protein VK642_09685 [Burkholderiales bacterium]|nr:hypothetical protein [Burkholderiales bacterium]
MTQLEVYLLGVAGLFGRSHYEQLQAVKDEIVKAQQLFEVLQMNCNATASLVAEDQVTDPILERARQAEKDLAAATVELGKLEVDRDLTAKAFLRGQSYMPKDNNGRYACPKCWVNESLSVALRSVLKSFAAEHFVCQTCNYNFTFDSLTPTTNLDD